MGHQVIHENDMIMLVQCVPECFLAAGNRFRLNFGCPQQLLHNKQIGCVVIHNEHLCLRCLKSREMLSSAVVAVHIVNIINRDFSDLLLSDDLLRNLN